MEIKKEAIKTEDPEKAELKRLFQIEARNAIKEIQAALINLKKKPKNKKFLEIIERKAHSLEGNAMVLANYEAGYFANKLDQVAKTANMNLLKQLFDSLKNALEMPSEKLSPKRKAEQIKSSTEILEKLDKAEQEAEEAEKRYSTMFEFIPSAIFTVDKKQIVTSWNRKAEEITGYTPDEMIGQKCTKFALFPCTEKCGLYAKDVKKPVIGKECTIKTKSGKIVTISKNVDFLKDLQGNITGGIESFNDITKQKEAEENSRKRLKELERFHNVTIGRESKMVELKKEVRELKLKLNKIKKWKQKKSKIF